MYKHSILIDILIAQELVKKGKEYINKGKTIVSIASKKLDKGGTSISCLKGFKNIDFKKGPTPFKTDIRNT